LPLKANIKSLFLLVILTFSQEAIIAQCGFSPNIFSSTGSFSFCQGNSITLNASPTAGARFSWYRQGVLIFGQTGSSISVSDAANYSALITIAGCTDTAFATTSINALPTVALNIPANLKSVCSNVGSFSINSYASPVGGFWIINGSAAFPTIIPALGANTYAIEYTATNINGCSNTARDTVEVLAQPAISITAVPSICENEDPFDLSPYGSPSGGTWTGVGVNSSNLYSPSSSGLFTLSYSYTNPSSGCSASQTTQSLVNAAPNVTFNPFILPDQCEGEPANSLSNFVSPTPGSSLFNSTFEGPGIINPSTGLFFPDSANIGDRDTLWYTAINTLTSCADSAFSLITVNPKPIVDLSLPDSIVCENEAIFTLTGGSPSGGSYIGQAGNVVSGRYNPGFAGPGLDTVYYLFFDFNGCSDAAAQAIDVKSTPSPSLVNLPTVCENDSAETLNQGLPLGGVYSGNGIINDTVFDPKLNRVAVGPNQLRYTLIDSFGCQGSVLGTIQVNAKPVVNFSMDPNLCTNIELVDLNNNDEIFAEPAGGSFLGDSVLNDTLYLFGYEADSIYNISYTYADGSGCRDTSVSFFQMHRPPAFNIESRGTTCIDVPVNISVVEEYQYVWSTGSSEQSINPEITSDSSFYVTVSDFFCSNDDSVFIELIPPSLIVALSDSFSTAFETPMTFEPLLNDSGRLGSIEILSGPFNGDINITDGKIIDYSPDSEFRRVDTINYRICDEICSNICSENVVLLNVLGDPYAFIPNAFTPDGDGTNDNFVIPGIEAYPSNSLRVFNIQGEMVFSSEPYNNEWDGTLQNGSLPGIKAIVPDGTYYYVLSLGEDKLSGDLDIRTR